MSRNHLLLAVGAALGIAVICYVGLSSIAAGVIGGLIGGGCIAALLVFRDKKPSGEEINFGPTETTTEVDTSAQKLEAALQAMLVIALHARERGLDGDCLARLHTTIDALRSLLSGVYAKEPTSDSTASVTKYATEVLPKTVRRFASLTGNDRAAHKETFFSALGVIGAAVTEAQENLDTGNAVDFRVEEQMLSQFGIIS